MIGIGSDHGGFELKEEIKRYFGEHDIDYKDFGIYSTESCDYPDIAKEVCGGVLSGEVSLGILVCGTGIGISIAANKIKGIRAALCSDTYSAKMARMHNDANVLALGGRVLGVMPALEIVDAFLNTKFEGGRHQRRVDKITLLEDK